jgi:prepilin-type processing-associated H-X9-DG protein
MGATPLVAAAAAADKPALIAEHFLDKGYGTNYMTTWFMSRTGVVLDSNVGSSGGTITCLSGVKVKGLIDTLGPLSRRDVESSPHSSSIIPLFGDANVGDQKEAFLKASIPGYMKAGDRLVESFCDGPAYLDATGKVWHNWGDADVTVHEVDATGAIARSLFLQEQPPVGTVAGDYGDPTPAGPHLQDYRDFGPVHNGACNILFADGHIEAFKDLNGDGYLNPGFPVASDATPAEIAALGIADALVELPAAEIFSGVFLKKFDSKGNLD